jgi:phosphopantothenate---cysteine ligase (CTP)
VNCLITAGPTFEPLDQVRRLTNFSTGKLGSELGSFLVAAGHRVTLLRSASAVHQDSSSAHELVVFNTSAELEQALSARAGADFDALFHAAAVSDFSFGKIYSRTETGELVEVQSGKLSTRTGPLLAELLPTPKIIMRLRDWFPTALLAGWKYEVDGGRSGAVAEGQRQIQVSRTNVCVVNGPAYGKGFGLLAGELSQREAHHCLHLPDSPALFKALADLLEQRA